MKMRNVLKSDGPIPAGPAGMGGNEEEEHVFSVLRACTCGLQRTCVIALCTAHASINERHMHCDY